MPVGALIFDRVAFRTSISFSNMPGACARACASLNLLVPLPTPRPDAGPQFPCHIEGRPIRHISFSTSPSGTIGVMVSLISYNGHFELCIVSALGRRSEASVHRLVHELVDEEIDAMAAQMLA